MVWESLTAVFMAWEGLKDWTFLEMYNRRTSGNCPSWQQEEFQLVIKEKKKKGNRKDTTV